MDRCPYCNGTHIQQDIPVGQNAEVSAIGLKYRANFMMYAVEELHVDLCLDCGSVVRLYVKKTGRKWWVKNKTKGAG